MTTNERAMVKKRRKRNNGAADRVGVGRRRRRDRPHVRPRERAGQLGPQRDSFGPPLRSVFDEVTNVPASVFNTIGVSSTLVVPHNVFAISKGCPASPRRSTASRFRPRSTTGPSSARTAPRPGGASSSPSRGSGRSTTLYNMWSSATDTAGPNTPTFTFYSVTYTSKYLAFNGYEVEDRNGKPLMTPAAGRERRSSTRTTRTRPSRSWTSTTRRSSSSSAFDPLQPRRATRRRARSPRR